MDIIRILRHLSLPPWAVRRSFAARSMDAIEAAIRESEARHRGEIRFAVEAALEPGPLLRGISPRDRAREVFARLGVWDTAENNGVLIYLLLADRDVEIVADRGVHARVGNAEWESICRRMESAFRDDRFEDGVIDGIRAVSEILSREYPATGGVNPNELPDRPTVL